MKTKKLKDIMTKKDKEAVKEILKEYAKTFKDLGDYDTAPNKKFPMFEGLLKYFPNALHYVSHVSLRANEQHNPGEPLHWAKEKSTDEPDALLRHLTEVAKGNELDEDELLHRGKIAWRSLAFLERYLENNK